MRRILVLLTLLLARIPAVESATNERPNVVILLADDLGWRDLGCYDGPVNTPTINSLAKGGTRFSHFYSGAAVCSPSRAVLLTGRTHVRSGIYSWINDHDQRSHLPTGEVTIAEVLQRSGYQTSHFGKWHLGLPSKQFPDKPVPSDHGFDYWFATGNNAQPSHLNPRNFIRNGKAVGELQGYACDLVVDEAISWLERHAKKDQPFFLNLWFHEPHAPLAAPPEIVKRYGDATNPATVYSGTIENTDLAIKRLIDKLHAIDKPENTLIIYSSDNGSYRADRVGELRGTKGSNYEGGIRVPGIFFWPNHIAAGKLESEPAGLVDLLPTVCSITETEVPAIHLDGTDLSPLFFSDGAIEGESQTDTSFARQQPLFWYLPLSGPAAAMRDGRFVMVAYRDGRLPKDDKALSQIKNQIAQRLRDQQIWEQETRGSTFEKQLFEGFRDSEAERLRGQFIRLNQFNESWIPKLKQTKFTRFELYDLQSDPSQKTDLAIREPLIHARMKSSLLKRISSVSAEAFDWSSGAPAPTHEFTTLVHRFNSKYRSPFDAFAYMNRIPIEPEALEDQRDLTSRIESRLANQEGRVQIKLPSKMERKAYEGFKLAAGIGTANNSCFSCHHLPTFGYFNREAPVPSLRNRVLSQDQLKDSLMSEVHDFTSLDAVTLDRLLAFIKALNDVPHDQFRPLILNATVLDTTGDTQ